MNSVADNLAIIRQNVHQACEKAGRNPDEVKIIAVTKYVTVERAKEAIDAGIEHLGENRDHGFLEKYESLGENPVWHFIGTLQSRKVKNVIDKVDYIHSLDRLSLAKEINKRAKKKTACFVQVNVSGEETKHGIHPDETVSFIKQLEQYPNIQVVGLMTMAPFVQDENILRKCFRTLRELRDEVRALQLPYAPCEELSMGMSNDYQIAVEEGATYIRIGSSLVGES